MLTFISHLRSASTYLLVLHVLASVTTAQDVPTPPAPDQGTLDVYVKIMEERTPSVPNHEVPGLQLFTYERFDAGAIAWVLTGTAACLLLLAPGFVLFYAGWFRTSDLPSLGMTYILLASVMSIMWVLWGYSITFARSVNSLDVLPHEIEAPGHEVSHGNIFIGGTDHVVLRGLESQLGTAAPRYPIRRAGDPIPHLLFVMYQLAFFIAVPAPLVLALTGRLRTAGLVLFVVLWGTLVYAPITYWVWGGGWHTAALDTAGGITAQLSIGFAALAAALVLAPRSRPAERPPADRALLLAGMLLVWVGSAIWAATRTMTADGYSVNAFLSTHLAACAGLAGWGVMEWLMRRKVEHLAMVMGPMAGLMAIAAPCGYVVPELALMIGLLGGIVARLGAALVERFAASSPLWSVFVMHGIPGVLGGFLAGVFATPSVAGKSHNGVPLAGWISGNAAQISIQLMAIAAAAMMALLGTLVTLLLVRLVGGIRPDGEPRASQFPASENAKAETAEPVAAS